MCARQPKGKGFWGKVGGAGADWGVFLGVGPVLPPIK